MKKGGSSGKKGCLDEDQKTDGICIFSYEEFLHSIIFLMSDLNLLYKAIMICVIKNLVSCIYSVLFRE